MSNWQKYPEKSLAYQRKWRSENKERHNTALGLIGEDISALESLIKYLRVHQ